MSPRSEFVRETWHPLTPDLARALDYAAEVLGEPVAVFDMTAAEIPLPVVKAGANDRLRWGTHCQFSRNPRVPGTTPNGFSYRSAKEAICLHRS